jgi:hypothetical protein
MKKAKSSYEGQFSDRFLEHLDLLDLIHFWLTGWNGENFGSLSRISSQQDHFHSDIIKHVETYKCIVQDGTAMREFTKVEGDILVVKI